MRIPEAKLTSYEAGNTGCGAVTETKCAALSYGHGQWCCLKVASQHGDVYAEALYNIAVRVGGLGVHVDPVDGRTVCPKGVLPNSKTSTLI